MINDHFENCKAVELSPIDPPHNMTGCIPSFSMTKSQGFRDHFASHYPHVLSICLQGSLLFQGLGFTILEHGREHFHWSHVWPYVSGTQLLQLRQESLVLHSFPKSIIRLWPKQSQADMVRIFTDHSPR